MIYCAGTASQSEAGHKGAEISGKHCYQAPASAFVPAMLSCGHVKVSAPWLY
jgi:hypothetical protein